MPRVLSEKMSPLAGASVVVVFFTALLRRATTMPDLGTKLTAITLIWFVLLLLRWILAPKRRHSEHWLVQYRAMAGYYLPFPLAVFAANTVRYSDGTSTDHVAWCILLVVLPQPVLPWMFRMSAYTFGDSPFRISLPVRGLTGLGWLFLGFLGHIVLPQTSHFSDPLVILLIELIWLWQMGRILEGLRSGSNAVRRHNSSPSTNTWFSQPYWKNEIGQYSLIEDYDRHSVKKIALVSIKAIISSEWPPSFVRHHPVEQDPIPLLDSVRELDASTLRDINGPPTNGIKSLQRNQLSRAGSTIVDDFSWTCNEQETHTHTILIWHVATCYCELQQEEAEEDTNCYQVVTTALSRYCAYLVAFLPEFLPEHTLTTQIVFHGVLEEAKAAMSSMDQEKYVSRTEEEKRTKMRGLRLREEDGLRMTQFEKGVKLGRHLEKLDTSLRWKVMAEFWAETILYIAPSDDAALHVERLAKGGDFVTHLWAMLSNAGILKRAPKLVMEERNA